MGIIRLCLKLGCALGILLAARMGHAEPFLKNGETVRFDKDNKITFVDIGRQELGGGSMKAGSAVKFVVVVDGMTTEIGPFETIERTHRISSQVKQIRYRDHDSVWVQSRLGSRLDGVVLINVRTGEIAKEFRGEGFGFSTDSRNVSYIYPFGRPRDQHAVFVNDVMIYPIVRSGFRDGILGPETANGHEFSGVLRKEGCVGLYRVISLPTWTSSGELSFNADETRFKGTDKLERQPDTFFEIKAAVQVVDGSTTGCVERKRLP